MGKFNSAKMLGASDVAFQNRYNELIDLLDTGLSFERTVDGKRLRVVLNNQEGLSFYEGATRRGGLAVINNELSLITDVLTSAINMSAFLKFDTLDYSSGTSSRLGFFVPDMITPSTTPIKTMDLFGAYIQGGSSVKIIDTGIRASSDDLDEIVLFRIRTDSDTTMTETLHSTENSWHVIQNSLTWGGVNSVSYTLGRTGFDIGSMGTKWLEVKSGETKVFGTAKATGLVIEGGIANAILGYTGLSWVGSTTYPTLMSSNADRFVMHLNPHIVYTQNGQRGYTGTTCGANIRFEKDTSTGGYWDVGVLSDRFRISRQGATPFFIVHDEGGLGVVTINNVLKLHAGNEAIYSDMDVRSDGTGVTLHLYRRNAGGYLQYQENWWDGNAYHLMEMRSNGIHSDGYRLMHEIPSSMPWGSINIYGTKGGYSGFTFAASHHVFMVRDSDGLSGVMKSSQTWAYYFDGNGRLEVGSIPWARVVERPDFATGSGTSNGTGGADTNVSFGKTFASPPKVCANSINGSFTCRIKSVSTTGFVLVISGGSVTFNYIAVLV